MIILRCFTAKSACLTKYPLVEQLEHPTIHQSTPNQLLYCAKVLSLQNINNFKYFYGEMKVSFLYQLVTKMSHFGKLELKYFVSNQMSWNFTWLWEFMCTMHMNHNFHQLLCLKPIDMGFCCVTFTGVDNLMCNAKFETTAVCWLNIQILCWLCKCLRNTCKSYIKAWKILFFILKVYLEY